MKGFVIDRKRQQEAKLRVVITFTGVGADAAAVRAAEHMRLENRRRKYSGDSQIDYTITSMDYPE